MVRNIRGIHFSLGLGLGLGLGLFGLLCASCGGGKTAAWLVLTPDPAIAPPAVVLRQIRKIDVIVDGRDGLRGVTAPGPLPGGGTAVDWDVDGQLEVRFEGPSPGSELPVLEVGVGDNAGRDLAFRIFGFASPDDSDLNRAAGEGGASATIAAGEVRQVGVPFNLTPRVRPPQVLVALPAEGVEVPGNLGSMTVVLSTTVKPETLSGNIRLTDPKGVELPISTKAQTATVTGTMFGKEERSLLSITVPVFYVEGVYTLQVGPGIVSTTGRRFDQDPRTETEDAFIGHIRARGGVGGGGRCEVCPEGYVCDDSNRCAPALACSPACPQGFVCDTRQAHCVEDCRRYELCFDTSTVCDARSGLCQH